MVEEQLQEPVSQSAFAKHLGVSVQMVSKAIRRGRLTAAVIVMVDGRPKIRDVGAAEAEWTQNMMRPSRMRPVAPSSPAENLDWLSVTTFKGEIVLFCSDPKAAQLDLDASFAFPLTPSGARQLAEALLAAAEGRR